MLPRLATFLCLLLLTPGCAWVFWPFRGLPPPLVEISPEELPPLTDDLDPESLRTAIERSIEFYGRAATQTIVAGGRSYSGAEFAETLRWLLMKLASAGDSAEIDGTIRSNFRFLRATGQHQQIRFTGYYTPVLRASLEGGGPYQYPIYGRPSDLITLDASRAAPGSACATALLSGRMQDGVIVPYHTRADIERGGALRGLGLEIAWTNDPIGLFFLHVQGSGRLLLPNGQVVQVNYAGTNGRPYTSIARVLADRDALPPAGGSMQVVRDYLAAHPLERESVLQENQRYTFFRLADTGPVGSIDVEVTAGRSIATDPTFFPPGSLAYIRTRVPVIENDGTVAGWAPLRRLVLNQDAGAAITGPARVDIYFGAGEAAERVAGRMAADGDLYFLVPRPSEASAGTRGTY